MTKLKLGDFCKNLITLKPKIRRTRVRDGLSAKWMIEGVGNRVLRLEYQLMAGS